MRAICIFDISHKNLDMEIENRTHIYFNINSSETLTRNIMSKTCERKEYTGDSCKFRSCRISRVDNVFKVKVNESIGYM